MEIVKNSESYSIKGTLENGFEISGNMILSEKETVINFTVYKETGSENEEIPSKSELGNVSWRKFEETVTFNYYVYQAFDEQTIREISKETIAEVLAYKKD